MSAYGAVLSALADPTRRAVLESMRDGPRSVGELARGLPVSRPAVSQHLAVLRDAGLVSERRDGARRLYRLEASGLTAVRAYLDGLWSDVLESYAAAATEQAAQRQEGSS